MGQEVLDEVTGYLLKRVHAALRAEMEAVLRPLGLTVAQYACLEVLDRADAVTSAQLAREAFISRQSMTVLLSGMESRGWVEVVRGKGRARPYRITATGRAALDPGRAAVTDVEGRMVGALDSGQRRDLHELLGQCLHGLTVSGS
ncbi:MarR family winged helix-turn-helix transcriptional regulator [Ruania alba]|uniref:DNA-binding transcriptional regulator, MarR family n=1 Tax=Ruania alba TaxID=648782 RepID=A0A1H5MVE8_9MICO|nr:MarR family winged helix-turn-helix transcriptional regulator [Ruania alba]SEE93263.1 DNA-binding transcriptional regulator, MarR family [Ruania alba]